MACMYTYIYIYIHIYLSVFENMCDMLVLSFRLSAVGVAESLIMDQIKASPQCSLHGKLQ